MTLCPLAEPAQEEPYYFVAQKKGAVLNQLYRLELLMVIDPSTLNRPRNVAVWISRVLEIS